MKQLYQLWKDTAYNNPYPHGLPADFSPLLPDRIIRFGWALWYEFKALWKKAKR